MDGNYHIAALAMRERAAEDCDGYCYECATAIRALPVAFTDAELLAAAGQLSKVRALLDAANAVDDEYGVQPHGPILHSIKALRAALAPFTKGGE
jgi:hypothetical protein